MLKKYIKFSVIFITLFSFCIYDAYAYEFKDPNNYNKVNDLIIEIYDRKEMYEDLVGDKEEEATIYNANNSSYWLPIGSEKTVQIGGKLFANAEPIPTYITSNFGYREDPFGRDTNPRFHSGLDLANGIDNGIVNIVAAQSGIVVYPSKDSPTSCPSSTTLSNCGGGYGNHVIIQHSDGNYTLYGHLHANSITVTAGDSVEQGQVIGKMGSSGNSTGTHLHFEVREGQNAYNAAVDPLNYISIENPRVVSLGSELVSWLASWEGKTPIVDNCYTVVDGDDGVLTVGVGVTLENNPQRFLKYGIDIIDYPEGSLIPIDIVDQIKLDIVNDKRISIEGYLSKNSITLLDTQVDALISQSYNIGNISGFAENYKEYGNTQEFYDNWFFRAIMKGTKFERGLTRRRNAEWALFNRGEYVYNS